jgi:hypothetical protein
MNRGVSRGSSSKGIVMRLGFLLFLKMEKAIFHRSQRCINKGKTSPWNVMSGHSRKASSAQQAKNTSSKVPKCSVIEVSLSSPAHQFNPSTKSSMRSLL